MLLILFLVNRITMYTSKLPTVVPRALLERALDAPLGNKRHHHHHGHITDGRNHLRSGFGVNCAEGLLNGECPAASVSLRMALVMLLTVLNVKHLLCDADLLADKGSGAGAGLAVAAVLGSC